MNIFILNQSAILSAQQQCDKHVVKMVLESAQMLSTAHRLLDGKEHIRKSVSGKRNVKYWEMGSSTLESKLYKVAHPNHPCTIWTIESSENYNWHYEHFVALCEEYQYRYGKTHLSDSKLRETLKKLPKNIKQGGLTQFKLAMGSNPECIDINNPVESYRKFYKTKEKRFKMVWTKREVPTWFNGE